jgi:predicted Zn-dependent protease
VTDFLGAVSDRPDIKYRLTILNSPVVNAFALPAGYVYVTRGLLALADTEAQVAGLIAHEIGHVTARHMAERYSRTVVAQGIIGLLGAATQGTSMAGLEQLAAPAALLALQSYSREQENQADTLAIRAMSRAGYDPQAMATFLEKMEANARLQATLAGQAGQAEQSDIFATHPRTADRVRNTLAEANLTHVQEPMTARDIYLGKIDGMLYGDDPEQGFVRGRVFAHPTLDLRFEAPEGFGLVNGAAQVVAQGPTGSAIVFDAAPERFGGRPMDYLTAVWAKDVTLSNLETLNVNGMNAATGTVRLSQQGQQADLRLVVIRKGDTLYRFLFVTPPQLTASLSPGFQRTLYSFRELTGEERRTLRPYYVDVETAGRNAAPGRLAQAMPYASAKEERFRVLNGLAPGQPLPGGSLFKTVTER